LYVHRVHNQGGIFNIMLDTPLDIADCRSIRLMYNNHNYVSIKLHMDNKEYLLHRLIVSNVPDGYQVDHIDNNPLNNARANLRIVTSQQNSLNRRMPNSTGLAGVEQVGKRFRARVLAGGKVCCIGRFDNAREAAMMRDEVMQVVGQGYSKFNFEKHERCLSESHTRQVAAFLNKHHFKL